MTSPDENHVPVKPEEKPQPVCTCADSPFGMDIDRCPVHGIGCA
jgi:hypothetical protein